MKTTTDKKGADCSGCKESHFYSLHLLAQMSFQQAPKTF